LLQCHCNEGRIAVSRNVEEVLSLADSVYKKHQADGPASPLLNLDGISWDAVGSSIPKALEFHKEAERMKSQMEKAYRERDLLMSAIDEAVKSSRNLLKALNRKNPKRLTDWGFEVTDSVPAAKVVAKAN